MVKEVVSVTETRVLDFSVRVLPDLLTAPITMNGVDAYVSGRVNCTLDPETVMLVGTTTLPPAVALLLTRM